jgi:hypothetical protein
MSDENARCEQYEVCLMSWEVISEEFAVPSGEGFSVQQRTGAIILFIPYIFFTMFTVRQMYTFIHYQFE